MSPKVSCAKGFVISLWCYWEEVETKEMGPRKRKLGHALEGDIGSLSPLSLSFFSSHLEMTSARCSCHHDVLVLPLDQKQ